MQTEPPQSFYITKVTYLITCNRHACTYFFHWLMNQSITIKFKKYILAKVIVAIGLKLMHINSIFGENDSILKF